MKMRRNMLVLATVIAAFFMMMLPGCQNPLTQREGPGDTGVGTLTLDIGRLAVGRTILPDYTLDDFYRVSVLITAYDYPYTVVFDELEWRNRGTTIIELPEGTWHVHVNAFAYDHGGVMDAVAGGSAVVDMMPNARVAATVILRPGHFGFGTFAWEIPLVPGITIDSLYIWEYSYDGMGDFVYNFVNTYANLSADPVTGIVVGHVPGLAVGRYIVAFWLSDGEGGYQAVAEILHIYNGLTSTFRPDEIGFDYETLISRILGAFDYYDDADDMLAYFASHDITGFHFGLPHYYYYGVPVIMHGVPIDLSEIVPAFVALMDSSSVPQDRLQLMTLIDAALVYMASTDPGFNIVDLTLAELGQQLEDLIEGLMPNGSVPDLLLVGNVATVTVGPYQVTVVFHPIDARDVVYTLSSDEYFLTLLDSAGTDLEGTPHLRIPGAPGGANITVSEYQGYNYMLVRGRTADWHGVDVMVGQMSLLPGNPANVYTVRVSGRVPPGGATGAVRLQRVPGYATMLSGTPESDGTFILTHTITAAQMDGLIGIRISSATATMDFDIYTIELGTNLPADPPLPFRVPGADGDLPLSPITVTITNAVPTATVTVGGTGTITYDIAGLPPNFSATTDDAANTFTITATRPDVAINQAFTVIVSRSGDSSNLPVTVSLTPLPARPAPGAGRVLAWSLADDWLADPVNTELPATLTLHGGVTGVVANSRVQLTWPDDASNASGLNLGGLAGGLVEDDIVWVSVQAVDGGTTASWWQVTLNVGGTYGYPALVTVGGQPLNHIYLQTLELTDAETGLRLSINNAESTGGLVSLNVYDIAVFRTDGGAGTGDSVSITVAGTEQIIDTINVVGADSSVAFLPGGDGFTFTRGGSWEAHYAWFTVDFGTNRLVDFETVTLTYQGVSGDIGNKNLELIASAMDFSGNIVAANRIAPAQAVHGMAVTPITFTINSDAAVAFTESEVRFSIWFNARSPGNPDEYDQGPTAFTVSGIVFNLGDPCGDCDNFPCTCACDYCGQADCECILVLDDTVDVFGVLSVVTGTGTIGADVFAVLQAARSGSIVRLTLRNDAGADRTGWGLGHFGNITLDGFNPFPAGEVRTVDIDLPLVSSNIDIQNGATIVGVQLWRLVPPPSP